MGVFSHFPYSLTHTHTLSFSHLRTVQEMAHAFHYFIIYACNGFMCCICDNSKLCYKKISVKYIMNFIVARIYTAHAHGTEVYLSSLGWYFFGMSSSCSLLSSAPVIIFYHDIHRFQCVWLNFLVIMHKRTQSSPKACCHIIKQ